MKRLFLSSVYQSSPSRFSICLLCIPVTIILSSLDILVGIVREMQTLPYRYHLDFMRLQLSSDAFLAIIPIISTIPSSGCYVDEIKSKYIRYILLRTNYQTYIIGKLSTCFVFGGLLIAGGYALTIGLSKIFFSPLEQIAEDCSYCTYSTLYDICMLFLVGGFWALVGLATSSILESKYIAYSSPFILYYLLIILYERYFSDAFLWYPPNWINSDAWPYGTWGVAVFLIELTLALGVLFAICSGRRLRKL